MGNCRKKIVQFELIYKNIFFSILYPLVFKGMRYVMEVHEIRYLTNQFFYRFLMLPHTMIWQLCIVLYLCLGLVYELLCLDRMFLLKSEGKVISLYQVCMNAIKKMRMIFKVQNILILPYCLCLFLFMNLVVFYDFITQSQVMSALLGRVSLTPDILGYGLTLLLMLAAFVLLGFYAIRFYMNGEGSFLKCYQKSIRISWNYKWQIIWRVVMVNIFALLFYGICYVVLSVVVIVGVWIFRVNDMGIAIYLSVLRFFNQVVHFALIGLSVPVSYRVMWPLYQKYTYELTTAGTFEEKNGWHRKGRWIGILLFSVATVVNIRGIYDERMNNVYNNIELMDEISITAHRGSSSKYPENTMVAFRQAVYEMADYIELDVRQTMDGELVIMHDSSLKRTTGFNQLTGKMTTEDITQLDAGSWKSPNYAGEPVPTLEEVLKFAKGTIKLNLDLKTAKTDRDFAKTLVELLEKYEMEEACILSSFQLDILREIKERAPQLRIGLILSAAYGDFYSINDVDFFSMNYAVVNREMIERAHNAGKEVHVWTVNSTNAIRHMIEIGVDNIITDQILTTKELLYAQNADYHILTMLRYVFDR